MAVAADSLRQRLVSGGAKALAGRIVSSGSNLAISAVVARILSPNDVGAFFLIFSVATAASIVARAGLEKTVLRLVAESVGRADWGRARAVAGMVLRVAPIPIAVVALSTWALGPVVFRSVFGAPAIAGLAGLTALWVTYLAWEFLVAETFRGFGRIGLASLFGGALSRLLILSGLVGLYLLTDGTTLADVLTITVLFGALSLVPAGLTLRGVTGRLDREASASVSTLDLVSISLPLLVTNVAFFASRNIDLWILAGYRPEAEVALYGAALRLVLLVGLALSIVDAVLPPVIAELNETGRQSRLQEVARATATFAGIPAFLVLVAFIVFGDTILAVAFGEYYREAHLLLAVLSLGQCANVFAGSCGYVLIMTGHQRDLMRAALVGSLITATGAFLAASRFGPTGVALAAAGGVTVQNLLILVLVRHRCGIWTHVGISYLWRPLLWKGLGPR